jgi:hypothetical protein
MTGTQALAERLHEALLSVAGYDTAHHARLAAAILADGSVYLTPAEAAQLLANLDRIDAELDALREVLETPR